MTDAEREELDRLRREDNLRSLGDRPSSPPVKELRRLIELERKATAIVVTVSFRPDIAARGNDKASPENLRSLEIARKQRRYIALLDRGATSEEIDEEMAR